MFSRLTLSLAVSATLALGAAACSDSTDDIKAGADAGGQTGKEAGTQVRIDSGVVVDDSGKVVVPDGTTGTADTAAPVKQDCSGIIACANKCGSDLFCLQGCIGEGTKEAQAQFQAILQCMQGSAAAACKDKCTNPKAPECNACVSTACEKEAIACGGGGGPVIDGFGAICDPAATPSDCKTGMTCSVTAATDTKGFCNLDCTNPGGFCGGSADGQLALCAFQTATGNRCGFVCKTPTFADKACPTGMTCTGPEQQGITFCAVTQ